MKITFKKLHRVTLQEFCKKGGYDLEFEESVEEGQISFLAIFHNSGVMAFQGSGRSMLMAAEQLISNINIYIKRQKSDLYISGFGNEIIQAIQKNS